MATLVPVDNDPFAGAQPSLVPVEHDPFAESAPVTAGGLYNALDRGVAEGVAGIGGLPRAAVDLATPAANYILRKMGLPERQAGTSGLPTSGDVMGSIQRQYYGGVAPYEPKNTAEEYARTLGSFAPMAAVPVGSVPARIAETVIPALTSETAGQLTKGTEAEPYARTIAALGGSAAVTKGLNAAARVGAYRGAPAAEGELGSIVDQGYAGNRASGVELNPTYISRGLGQIANDLTSGVNARDPSLIDRTLRVLGRAESQTAPNQPGAMAALTGVQPTAKAPVDFTRLDAIRRNLGEIARSRDPAMRTEAAAARIAQEGIDNLLQNAANVPGAVIRGDARALAQAAQDVRGNAAAEFRLNAMRNAGTRAEDAANPGDLSYRAQMRSFIRPNNSGVSPATREGLNAGEIAAIRDATRAVSVPRVLSGAGSLLGGNLPAIAGGAASYQTGDPNYFLAAMAMRGARGIGNAMMRSRQARLERMIAARSPEAVARGVLPPYPQVGNVGTGLLGGLYATPTYGGLLQQTPDGLPYYQAR